MAGAATFRGVLAAIPLLLLGACGNTADAEAPFATTSPFPAGATSPTPTPTPDGETPAQQAATPAPTPTPEPSPQITADADGRPDWLGTRVLPLRPDGFGEIQPTPEELVDRRLPPPAGDLPAPTDDAWDSTIGPVPPAVAERSTWHEGCPVDLDELVYATITFWGFDDRAHRGELLLDANVASDVVGVFERLYEQRSPLEEVRITRPEELDAPPTGDGNVTTAFVCRDTVEGARWSDHAYGRAVDINPFHNPYSRGDLVVPELASAYLDRSHDRPGMVQPGDVVTTAFAEIGWGWGGNWQSAKDWMHFSASGH